MSGNGAFAKANGILPFEEAVMEAAVCARRAIELLQPPPPGVDRYASHRLDDAARLAKVAAGLSAYVLMLSEVRP